MMFQIAFFVWNGKFSMKCIEKFDVSAKGVSRKILDMLIDHCNVLWKWIIFNFPDFS